MIEIVAEQGYDAVTVRELARRSGVSTRAFYRHYSGKEECLLRVQHLVHKRILGRLELADARVVDDADRLRSTIAAILDEWDRDLPAAHLALIDSYAAGGAAWKQAWQASRSIERYLGGTLPPLVASGILSGVSWVVRLHLVSQEGHIASLGDELVRWALSYQDCSAAQLTEPNRSLALEDQGQDLARPFPEGSGDLAAFLAAAVRLGAEEDRESITVGGIAAAAGLPRRGFYLRFQGVEDCLDAALEARAGQLIALAEQAGNEHGKTPTDAVRRTAAALCDQVAADPNFARFCFDGGPAAGAWRVRCHQRLIDAVAGVIDRCTSSSGAGNLVTTASAAALWGALQNEVMAGRGARLFEAAPACAYLLLAPHTGEPDGLGELEVERGEHALIA